MKDGDTRLLHPLTDDLTQHIVDERDGTLRPLTTLGQVYLDHLQLNRSALVQNRLERRRLSQVESRLAEIETTLRSIVLEIKKKQA